MAGTEGCLEYLDLPLYEATGLGEVGKGSYVFDVLALEELLKIFCDEGRAIVCVDDARRSVLGTEVLEFWGKGKA